MRRDKTVARIVLVLSIVHGALAAPVVIQQRYPKRKPDDKSPHPVSVVSIPASDSEVAPDKLGDSNFTARSSPSGADRYLKTPVSGARQLHNNPPARSRTLQTRNDMLGTSGTPSSQNGPPAGSGDPQLHNDPPATAGTPPSQDDPRPASGTPQLHNDPSPTSGAPSSKNDPSSSSGDPQLHNDPTTLKLGTPGVHNDLSPGEFDDSYRWLNDLRPIEGGTPSESSYSESEAVAPGISHSESQLHNNPPAGSGGLQLHNNPPVGSGGLQLHNNPPAGSGGLQVQGNPANSEAEGFFNDARKEKLKLYGKVGAVLGISAAVLYGVHTLVVGPGSKPASRELASSGVVDRGASMHPRSQKKLMSRALALAVNLRTRNKDLQLLRALTSRALERLD